VLAALLVPAAAIGGFNWTHEEPVLAVAKGYARGFARDYLAFWRAREHRDLLLRASEESGVEPELLAAIMISESSGRVNALSKAKAMGLFQVSMTTAKWRAAELGLPEPTRAELLSDGELNARLGADNMAWLLASCAGDPVRALAVYNAGWGTMQRIVGQAGGWPAWKARAQVTGDSEIFNYTQKVLAYRDEFRERGLFQVKKDEL